MDRARNRGSWLVLSGFLWAIIFLTACQSDGYQGGVFVREADGSIGPMVKGTSITFTREDGATTQTTTSDENGRYRLLLSPARYRVTAAHLAFEPYDSAPGFFVVTGDGLQTGNIFLHRTDDTVVLLARHAEKANTTPNTNLDPDPDDLGIGIHRAETLGAYTSGTGVVAVYATEYCRTAQTSQPTALALGIPLQIQTTTDPNAGLTACIPALTAGVNNLPASVNTPAALAQHILQEHTGEVTLVVGHSNTIPQIISALGAPAPCPTYLPLTGGNCFIPENEFNHLFAVKLPLNGGQATLEHQTYGP